MGPKFFETIMGRRFFDGQLPSLIHAIEKVGEQIEKTAVQQAAMLERLPPAGIQEENERLREALRIANERNEQLEKDKALLARLAAENAHGGVYTVERDPRMERAEEIAALTRDVATLRRRCGLHEEYEKTVNDAMVVDETSQAVFHPWHADGLLGYRCVLKDGTETFITLVPANSTDDGEPVVFSYFGTTGDPEVDAAMCHCTMNPRKDSDG